MKISLCFTHPRGILGVSDESNRSYIKNCLGYSKRYHCGGCFCSTVQITSNKARTSIIKRASCGSGAWIKASCSESMHCCKKNKKNSNVINTFVSLLLSVVHGSHSGGWRRTYALRARFWDMLVSRVCLQEQRKQSFLTLAKENQSPHDLYLNPPTFFFINPRFVLLIHDRHFILFSLHIRH